MVPVILIVGGGFCGVALTHALARLRWPQGVRIVVADRSGRFGRGAAYSTNHPSHLLNVPAGRMGALAEDESHFLAWLRASDPTITGDAFVPRSRYGDYLEHVFDEARRRAAPGVKIEALGEQVTAIHEDRGRLQVQFESGRSTTVDRTVLAIGNLPPRNLEVTRAALANDDAYVPDPWAPRALERITGAESVLLIGTGLTMVDVVLALHDARPETNFVAVSRHGLLPQSHRDAPTRPIGLRPARALESWNGTASGLLRIVREEANVVERDGLDWRDVINGLRPITQALWYRMPPREQARFYRHVRPFWDTHRHRMSTRVSFKVDDMIASQQLSIVAGRIASCARDGGRVAVGVRRRDGQAAQYVVDAVVNCTGPCSDLSNVEDALVASLRERGAIVPDALGIGMHTHDDGAAIMRDGKKSPSIFTLGGTRRPALWESTAVPELRVQAATLAERLHLSLHQSA
jgi:uncharacterized NAD(P)/FAD-binding protein YdhS